MQIAENKPLMWQYEAWRGTSILSPDEQESRSMNFGVNDPPPSSCALARGSLTSDHRLSVITAVTLRRRTAVDPTRR